MILDTILEHKKVEVAARKATAPLDDLMRRAKDAPPALDFAGALRQDANCLPAVIAEVKKASPSKGVIRSDFDPEAIARAYESAGAAAVSVLTDEEFFQGSLDYLTLVKQTISLPVLRKDFIIDEYQLWEARAAGADAALLIVAALDADLLRGLMANAESIGLQCLVEVHDEPELNVALSVGAQVIGINNRNLQTFEVSLETTTKLMRHASRAGMPRTNTNRIVSESGIFTREDMVKLGAMGVDAVLIGEALMRERDIEAKLRELVG